MGHPDFNPPGKPPKLTARTSTLTSLFFMTLTPYIEPSAEEVDEALSVLGMERGQCVCAYCGDIKSEWDHFRAIVENRQPTGYITEIHNLVPACGKCNQSRGNKPWREWMVSAALHSPKSRGKPDIERRTTHLEAYERWSTPIRLDYGALAGDHQWAQHLKNRDQVIEWLKNAERLAGAIRSRAAEEAGRQRSITHRRADVDTVVRNEFKAKRSTPSFNN
jgi:hypothetical protein